MFPSPKPITIVTGSADDRQWFEEKLREHQQDLDEWEFTDLRSMLKKDPATSVGWKEE